MCQELIYLDSARIYKEESDLQLANAYERLGTIYFTKCMFGLAMENFVQAQALLLKYPQGVNKEMIRLYNNIGTVLHKQGEYDEAIASFKKSLDLFQIETQTWKDSTLEQALCHENFGLELAMTKNFEESIFNLKKAYVQKMHVCGESHPLLAENLIKMGFVLNKTEKPNKALKFLERALQMQFECKAKEMENISIYDEQAKAYLSKNNLSKACDEISKSLAIKKQNLSEDHISYASTHMLQGAVYKMEKNPLEAVKSFMSALEVLKKKVSFQHPDIVQLYSEMGNIYLDLNLYEKAADCYSKCIQIFSDSHHPEDEQTKLIQNLHQKCKKLQTDQDHKNRCLSQTPIAQMKSLTFRRLRDASSPGQTPDKSMRPKKGLLLSACGMCGGS